MKFKDYLFFEEANSFNEATEKYVKVIDPEKFGKNSLYRKEVLKTFDIKRWRESFKFAKKLMAELNHGKFSSRVIFDAKNYSTPVKLDKSQADEKIKNFLSQSGYIVTPESYAIGIAFKKSKEEVKSPGESKTVKISDIIGNFQDKLNKFQQLDDKIDKIKASGKEPTEKEKQIIKSLEKQKKTLTAFKTIVPLLDQAAFDDLTGWKIIFSLSPRELASQSTEVGWESCMNLVSGKNRHYVGSAISSGSIIAWLVRAGGNDGNALKPDDLKSPQARVLLKPMFHKTDKKEKNVYWYVDRIYPHNTKHRWFRTAVIKILEKHNAKVPEGTYNLAEGQYVDSKQQIKVDDVYKYITLNKSLKKSQQFKDLAEKDEKFIVDVISRYISDVSERED